MDVIQNDIFGKKHQIKNEKIKKPITPQSKDFFNVKLENGLYEQEAINNAMLIHRILQRKLIYSGLNNIQHKAKFLKVLKNELEIKRGKKDPVSAVRDSLIEFFVKPK